MLLAFSITEPNEFAFVMISDFCYAQTHFGETT